VSDQDFFFDEDEKPAAKSGAKKGSTAGKAAAPAAQTAAPVDAQSVTLMVAVLMGVIGVLLGVVIGLFIGKGMATPAVVVDTAATTVETSSAAGTAPQLTQEQLDANKLPQGHPQIPGAGSTTATPTK
jgi:hypothetical protein